MPEDKVKVEPLGTEGVDIGSEKTIAALETKLEDLGAIVIQQGEIIKKLSNEAISKLEAGSPTTSKSICTKPRDIPVLELNELDNLEASGKLNLFFDLVEQCSADDGDRVKVAKTRVNTELAMLIHNQQEKNECQSWEELKKFLKTRFAAEVTLDTAWQHFERQDYDWALSAQGYVNTMLYKFAIIESKFPTDTLPDREKAIKRKLWNGLPKEARNTVECFLDEKYPLNMFVNRVEHVRQFLVASHTPVVGKVEKEKPPPETPTPKAESKSELQEIKDQLNALAKQFERFPRGRQRYCSYCRSNSHDQRECTRSPPPGHCFDCRRKSCRRGHPDCPGKRQPNQQ